MNQIKRSNLRTGMIVEVTLRGRNQEATKKGAIQAILTNSETHTHGILVELTDGIQGRVLNVIEDIGQVEMSPVKADMTKPQERDVALRRLLSEMLADSENQYTEYKSSLLWSKGKSKEWIAESNSPEIKEYGDNTSTIIIAKAISAFLNSRGGSLLIGIKENKAGLKDEIIGINSELYKLDDPCLDGYRRYIVDRVLRPYLPSDIFNRLSHFIEIRFEEINDKQICIVDIRPSDKKAFLKIRGRDHFYIRVDATTREIYGEQIVNFCEERF